MFDGKLLNLFYFLLNKHKQNIIMRFTKNFTLQEMVASQTAANRGIVNIPNKYQIENLQTLCDKVLQPARDFIGSIFISSGFRCYKLNTAIGGSKSSQHCKGEAADIKCQDNAKLFHHILKNLDFDQLIWEFGDKRQPQWIHVSYKGLKNRRQVLVAYRDNGRTVYDIYENR